MATIRERADGITSARTSTFAPTAPSITAAARRVSSGRRSKPLASALTRRSSCGCICRHGPCAPRKDAANGGRYRRCACAVRCVKRRSTQLTTRSGIAASRARARGGGDLNGGIGVRARRKVHASCEHPLDPNAALTEPPEESGLAIPFVVLGARESDVKDAASDARLPWWDLSRLESATLAHHAELSQDMLSHPVRYVALRNLILYKWRENRAAGYVSRADCLACLGGPSCVGLRRMVWAEAGSVYWWLERMGLINYGATSRLIMRIPRPLQGGGSTSSSRSSNHLHESSFAPRRTIVVVGAGISGLCAAQQLRRFGHRVIVLEAQSRLGGRVLTEEVAGTPIDLGAMLLVGTVGNPLVAVCEQVGCRTHPLNKGEVDGRTCPLYDGEGVLDAEVDSKAESKFNALMTKADNQRSVRKGKRAMLGTSNGGRWEAGLLHKEGGDRWTFAKPPPPKAAADGGGGMGR